ncbi:uncharacterized protein EHS24_002434 [Apiotrichum porosum]|uniref:Uncharacterized protein n=1 Tax=Apiotrichum porosum TaxID=105984 RepID=A0A427XGU9_9TREE|nr:uncharacterized protein EHS24_002434 [Apiotrichum porosum]RSH77983.1 hypothetical protein EHS24_002434 [Apiotrichum porosum]
MDHDKQAVDAAMRWFEDNLEALDALPPDASAAPPTKSVTNKTKKAAAAEPKKKTAAPPKKKATKGAAPPKKTAPKAKTTAPKTKTTAPKASTSASPPSARSSRTKQAAAKPSPKPKDDPNLAPRMPPAVSVSAPTRVTQSRASKEAATRKFVELLSLSSSSSLSSSGSSSDDLFVREEMLDTSSESSIIVFEAEAPTVIVTSPTPNKGVPDVANDNDSATPVPDAVEPNTHPVIDGLDQLVQSYWLGELVEFGTSWGPFAADDNAFSSMPLSGGDTQTGSSSQSGTANSTSVEALTPRRFPTGGRTPSAAFPSPATPHNGQASTSASDSVSGPISTHTPQPQAGAFGLFN